MKKEQKMTKVSRQFKCLVPDCKRPKFVINGGTQLLLNHVLYCHVAGGDSAYSCSECSFNCIWTKDMPRHLQTHGATKAHVIDRRYLYADDVLAVIGKHHLAYLEQCKAAVEKSGGVWRLPVVVAVADEDSGAPLMPIASANNIFDILSQNDHQVVPIQPSSVVKKEQQVKRKSVAKRIKCQCCSLLVSRYYRWQHAFAQHSQEERAFDCPHCRFKSNISHATVIKHIHAQHPGAPEKEVVDNRKLHPEIVQRCFPDGSNEEEDSDDDKEESAVHSPPVANAKKKKSGQAVAVRGKRSKANLDITTTRDGHLLLDQQMDEEEEDERSYQCRICQITIPSATTRIAHFFQRHAKMTRFKCPFCDRGDRWERNQTELHMRLEHGADERMKCVDRAMQADIQADIEGLFKATDTSSAPPSKKHSFGPIGAQQFLESENVISAAAFNDLLRHQRLVKGVPVIHMPQQGSSSGGSSSSSHQQMAMVPMMVPVACVERAMQVGGRAIDIRVIRSLYEAAGNSNGRQQ